MSRGLKSASFSKRTSSQLLVGSAVDEEDESLDDFDVETVNGVETSKSDNASSLFMRAIIASTQPSSDSVAALVHLAKSGEIFSWTKELKTAGLPIDGIEIVSLTPHAPSSVEAKLQAQLLILHEEMSDFDSFEDLETHFSGGRSIGTTLSAFSFNFTRNIVSSALLMLLVAVFVFIALVQARKKAARAAAAASSEMFLRNAQHSEREMML
jgi:hypothetical protein